MSKRSLLRVSRARNEQSSTNPRQQLPATWFTRILPLRFRRLRVEFLTHFRRLSITSSLSSNRATNKKPWRLSTRPWRTSGLRSISRFSSSRANSWSSIKRRCRSSTRSNYSNRSRIQIFKKKFTKEEELTIQLRRSIKKNNFSNLLRKKSPGTLKLENNQ